MLAQYLFCLDLRSDVLAMDVNKVRELVKKATAKEVNWQWECEVGTVVIEEKCNIFPCLLNGIYWFILIYLQIYIFIYLLHQGSETVLLMACRMGYTVIVEVLLSHSDIDVNIQDKEVILYTTYGV